MPTIVAVNGSPRKNWNTDLLVKEAGKGAAEQGATVEYVDLYRLERFTGCISCFGCMLPKTYGRCVYRDGLTPVLDMIREADGLILGTPNYLSEISAGLRSLYERLIFQYITYNAKTPNCNTRRIPVLFIMTSNAPQMAYQPGGWYRDLVESYRQTLDNVIGPTKTLIAPDTLQVKDYSKYDWTVFDPEAKKRGREERFPRELGVAHELGCRMITGWDA